MPTRPSLSSIPISTSSQLITHHGSPIHNLHPLFAQLAFFIVGAKLEEDIGKIYSIIDELGGTTVAIEDAMIILTALKGRPRLLKALGKEWIDAKPVLDIEFVYDTFQTCLDAANKGNKVKPVLPSLQKFIIKVGPTGHHSPTYFATSYSRSKKRRREEDDKGSDDPPDLTPLPEDVDFRTIPKYCVQRACPLLCINQDIVDAIKPIFQDREMEETQQKNSNVLSYRRSISMLKSVPRRIRSGKEARLLTDVGEKVAMRIDEFLATGRIEETEEILTSSRHRAIEEFASLYTIGPHTAKDLYDKHHCRTLHDVKEHYKNIAEESEEVRLKVKERRRMNGGMSHVDIVEAWMEMKEDLDSKIPREEVEEIAVCVMENLSLILPGCQYTITGGYRRGKPQSNDVDIVIGPPRDDEDIGLLKKLQMRLSHLGIITHVLYSTRRSIETPIRAHANNFDNLDKVFVIFRLPGEGRRHRRVDIILAPRNRYAAAVLSWSGSMMFERDFKRYAENRGYKFKAAITQPNTGEEHHFETEREIFHFLGLRWVPPELRNAD
ncbi:putative beta DNA polymerase [Kockovaella imperatae]|uniref:DNA polymerase n=1 Tax=Kockovaella imperatae TaxID=4999 RepID=A0A1Y1UCF9_9TREE|nr:putative beta DNA polymerase [Kockovaella imperatae]ORX35733.1 putative beta DNA polymerase [Kockovaella imperatae]